MKRFDIVLLKKLVKDKKIRFFVDPRDNSIYCEDIEFIEHGSIERVIVGKAD